MAVKIVLGRIGSGKTRYVINDIKKTREMRPGRRCVVLVPSFYSHETEKLITDTFGGTGLNSIEVTSFEKLAGELVTGCERKLAAPGKHAVITRAVRLALDALSPRRGEFDGRLLTAVGRRGFAEVAASLISELHRYIITPDDLRQRAAEMEPCTLRQKLELTAMIAEKYEEILSDAEYIDSDDDLLRLSSVASDSFGADVSLWLDKFDELLPQQLEVLKAMITGGAEVTVTFNYNAENTYYGTLSAIKTIEDFTDTETVMLDGALRHIKGRGDLAHLFEHWHDGKVYDGAVDNAEVFEARDAYTEIEHTACRILDLVREDGYRFRDIAVICGDPDSYTHIIEAVFDEYEIPVYSDERYTIAEHPIAMQILSLFDITENGWDYLSMFTYLRAGFIYTKSDGKYRRIPSEDIDILENLVLKRGIRGRSLWCRPWTDAGRTMLDEAFAGDRKQEDYSENTERLRAAICAPLEKYADAAKAAKTVTDHCVALYEFLEDINLYAGLKNELLSMAFNRATAEAQRFGQIWNLILDVLDQINTALGATEATADEFAGYFRAAIGQCTISTIPSGVDRVFIGSVEKNRSEHTKVIFAIGMTSGTFPSEQTTEGFLSNADREQLAQAELKLAPVTGLKTEKGYNNVYKTLAAVTERLCLSYPAQTPDGQGCRPSQTAIDIISALPRIPVKNDITADPQDPKTMYISSPKATLHRLLMHPSDGPVWKHVNEWYDAHDEWRGRMIAARAAAKAFRNDMTELDPGLAEGLYPGQIFYSPTRLDTYAQCPYKGFLQYGIRAREREEYELNAADAGSYAHELIRRLCSEIDDRWDTVTDEECGGIVERITDETIKNINASALADKERTADILRRLGNTVKKAARTIRRSIASGEFRPYAHEKEVRLELNDRIGVRGTIDRVDICSHDGTDEYRIIDYKTGKRDFSVAEICAGIEMQPVIYSLVMREESARSRRDALISGMYYEKVRSSLYAAGATAGDATIRRNVAKENTMLHGATFIPDDGNGNPDPAAVARIESMSARENGSLFFGDKGIPEYGKTIHTPAAASNLMDAVRDRILETDKEIRSGHIAAAPLKTGQDNACKYCAYTAVCKFREDKKTERVIEKTDAEVWKELEGGEKA